MSTAQRTHYQSWEEELAHRQKVILKLEKIQGLEALLEAWEARPQDSDEYHDYLRHLRKKLHIARTQYSCMKP